MSVIMIDGVCNEICGVKYCYNPIHDQKKCYETVTSFFIRDPPAKHDSWDAYGL